MTRKHLLIVYQEIIIEIKEFASKDGMFGNSHITEKYVSFREIPGPVPGKGFIVG